MDPSLRSSTAHVPYARSRRSPVDRSAARFHDVLRNETLYDALAELNGTTDFRFTGVYRFEEDLVMNVVLFDRENPGLRVGEDVRLEESYCGITAELGDSCTIEDACEDPRLEDHAAREAVQAYCAVLLRTPDGDALGTLCHFDIRPRPVTERIFELLEAVRPDVERALLAREGLPLRNPDPRIADFG